MYQKEDLVMKKQRKGKVMLTVAIVDGFWYNICTSRVCLMKARSFG